MAMIPGVLPQDARTYFEELVDVHKNQKSVSSTAPQGRELADSKRLLKYRSFPSFGRGFDSPSRRVSTTLRQVFAKFSEFFMCWGFSQKNFAPGSPGSDDLQLGRPTVSPLLSFFKRISHFQSRSLRSAVPERAC